MSTTLRRPPGPRGQLLGGNLSALKKDRLQFFIDCQREWGDFTSLRFGFHKIMLIHDPEAIEQVLVQQNKNFRKHFALRLSPKLLGKGLLSSDGNFWLRQRRMAQPAFQPQRLLQYGPTFVNLTQQLLETWKPGEERDFAQDMSGLMLRIATRVLFSSDVTGHEGDVGTALMAAQHHFMYRFNRVIQIPLSIPTAANREFLAAVKKLDDLVYGLIRERRREGKDYGDLLSMLLHARDEEDHTGMTDQQLRDEVMTLFLAGHETTALTLSWTWYMLTQHSEVQKKLQEEVDRVLGGRPCTPDDVPKLKYAESIVMETLRLYPPAYVIGREAIQPCEIGGYPVQKGMTVLMAQWSMHRDPRFWDEPLQFRPERWENDLLKRLPRIVYFPFGAGPRTCIGNTFAMMESIMVLATLVQRFELKCVPGLQVGPRPTFTLKPDKPLRMIVTPRTP